MGRSRRSAPARRPAPRREGVSV
ncbi:unnamed protein product [Ectocarpus sp. CCAP 1310/34]|nr:unnamed protein product [Ectocarpus sp. CCAP 1310/34]